ncbi:uncharacterized protein MELLADRAFT_117311 [Melampsora larici-populina 98AG31]|uniref:Uncharacterized protein n=1 Tax=Melampsora larici-populina (strain 98AG31 / pathotype 3-4-7) TaxID=747676 RepID=F4RVU2_MELLP|nr:uncharacterized protein MELLADRAFT_117311 [Melampsora larici-populina 98AG31]EGG03417.1 hypothetical protein MELLADRAFT_117311 [Melampsora larici-populina 98AG31]
MPTPSLARTLKSILNLVDQEEWYAAHQKYRTSAARLLKSNEPQSIQDAISLLFEGSKLLLQRHQLGSGTDLGLMLIRDVYVSRSYPYTEEERHKLLNLIALIGAKDNWRKMIIDSSISYSTTSPDFPSGDPALHFSIGEIYAKEKRWDLAEIHLLSAGDQDSAKSLSNVLWSWSILEKDLQEKSLGRYAGRGVIGYLEIGSITSAKSFLEDFLNKSIKRFPNLLVDSIEIKLKSDNFQPIQIFSLPSLNFLQLLILTCQIGPGSLPSGLPAPIGHTGPTIGKAVFQAMVGRYSRVEKWIGSNQIKESLDLIAEMYFGIKPQRQSGNILNDLMGSLFSGGGPPGPASQGSNRGSQIRGKPSSGISTPALD